MAEGDTILRAARRLETALGGERVSVEPHGRGRAAGVTARLAPLRKVEARGKHLLLHLGEVVLHSHLGMSGSWQLARCGERWGKPAGSAWLVLRGAEVEAVQFGGPTLRQLSPGQLRSDPVLRALGPDVLDPDADLEALTASLRRSSDRELGEALLDQRLVAGIGNIFKSESCFAAAVDPWATVSELSDEQLSAVLDAAREQMEAAVAGGRRPFSVYRRAGRPCPHCGGAIAARGQGDANRRTYWCPRCQPG